jgi:hypothetical protein
MVTVRMVTVRMKEKAAAEFLTDSVHSYSITAIWANKLIQERIKTSYFSEKCKKHSGRSLSGFKSDSRRLFFTVKKHSGRSLS